MLDLFGGWREGRFNIFWRHYAFWGFFVLGGRASRTSQLFEILLYWIQGLTHRDLRAKVERHQGSDVTDWKPTGEIAWAKSSAENSVIIGYAQSGIHTDGTPWAKSADRVVLKQKWARTVVTERYTKENCAVKDGFSFIVHDIGAPKEYRAEYEWRDVEVLDE